MSENITTTVSDETEGQLEFDGMPEQPEITVTEIVESLVTEELYNAYGIHKIVNATLEVLEVERRIPPQMMYNYSRNGLIEKGRGSSKAPNKNHEYTADLVKAFVTKWVEKNTK